VPAGDITVPKGADLLLVQSFNACSDTYFSLPERFWPEVSYMLQTVQLYDNATTIMSYTRQRNDSLLLQHPVKL
jgi:hypothetical protein